MIRLPEIQNAASAAAWGVPYRRLLTLRDRAELAVEQLVVALAVDRRREIEEGKAKLVGNAVAKALGG